MSIPQLVSIIVPRIERLKVQVSVPKPGHQIDITNHCSSKHRDILHPIQMGTSGSGKFVPDLSGDFALQIGQVFSWTGEFFFQS